jgi:hypothetical protein
VAAPRSLRLVSEVGVIPELLALRPRVSSVGRVCRLVVTASEPLKRRSLALLAGLAELAGDEAV